MSLPLDLFDQADMLGQLESRKPKQASLRRAVSTAYYALFHLLIEDAVAFLLPSRATHLRDQFARAFVHAEMKKAAQAFAAHSVGNPWVAAAGSIPPAVTNVPGSSSISKEERSSRMG